MKVAFIHPDLGIGGAERLVVDSALALQNKGHDVTIFTSYHDPKHAFDETKDGTLKVKVFGDTLFPRSIIGRFSILCAILRQLHLTKVLISRDEKFDLFIVDQLPATVPYLRMAFPNARVLFYCHHPDLLLTSRNSLVKKVYRLPFDNFERWCISKSDQIAVNSEYTRKVFAETFKFDNMPDPSVVYPVVDPTNEASDLSETAADVFAKLESFNAGDGRLALSINRFERKKDIELAISAFSLLLHAHVESRSNLLVVAGGYDGRVRENIEYLEELQALATKFRIPHATKLPNESWKKINFEKVRVLFLPSISSGLKNYLLKNAAVLLYTPTNEHFGIVPLEAMCAETPVLATNTGGPLETIVDGVTGWLREPDMESWYRVMKLALVDKSKNELSEMGKAGRQRVLDKFSLGNLELILNNLALKTKETPRKDEDEQTRNTKMVSFIIIIMLALIPLLALLMGNTILHYYPCFIRTIYW